MKINIGPYINWIGPYQIAEKILFWKDRYKDDSVHNFGTWLASNSKGEDSYLMQFCTWVQSKRNRKISIKIDNYDVWGMDTTLAMIIHPMLVKLKQQKHGFGYIANEDVPEELKDPQDTYCEKKYNWFLDELIWAFNLIANTEEFDYNKENIKRSDNALRLFGKYYRTLWD
jgi:hypothetical protein